MTCTRFETAGRTEESASTFREGVRHFGQLLHCSTARKSRTSPRRTLLLDAPCENPGGPGPLLEECPEAVCSAASVKSQQDVIVTVEDRHPPRRCHKRRVPLQIFTMRPSADCQVQTLGLARPSSLATHAATKQLCGNLRSSPRGITVLPAKSMTWVLGPGCNALRLRRVGRVSARQRPAALAR